MLQGKFEAKKHAARQTQEGWVVSFVIHPNDMTPEFAAAPLGTQLMLAYCEYREGETSPALGDGVADDTQADRSPKTTSASARGRAGYIADDEGGRAVTRAARMCKSPVGRAFLFRHPKAPETMDGALSEEDQAAYCLRHIIGVDSRRKIATDERAYNAFRDLEWQLEHPEARG